MKNGENKKDKLYKLYTERNTERQRERVKQTDRQREGTGSLHTLINKVQGEDSRGPGDRETEATIHVCGHLALQLNLPKSVRVHRQSAAECLLYSHNGRCVRELFPRWLLREALAVSAHTCRTRLYSGPLRQRSFSEPSLKTVLQQLSVRINCLRERRGRREGGP